MALFLYLIFQTKIPIQNFLLSESNCQLAVPFSLSESFTAFEWERSKCHLEREAMRTHVMASFFSRAFDTASKPTLFSQ